MTQTQDAFHARKRRALFDLDSVIASVESQQARPVRALLLDPTDVDAKARLQAIEKDLSALRAHRTSVVHAADDVELDALTAL